ncbi:WD40 repeat [Pseudovibrio ascidiaceicola]|uniref:WD40 repeat n=1 Tax=Pseudovibrio ascidiaceicola TaxID=285279 RepID=A0A1I4FY86_9HYPH|nr:WD40 repeat domain-containing protein [Pseudovibrio ascidiaceicola]SFL22815.1 WD40 repeat [Pseudovibrio ascidiaceicola]
MFYQSANSFAYDGQAKMLFAGTRYGKILILNEQLDVQGEFAAHDGMIDGISICPARKLIAAMGGGREIFLGSYDDQNSISQIFRKNIRLEGIDDVEPIHSTSQAVDLHPTEAKLITRTGNSSIVELDFQGNVLSSGRASFYDIITTKYSSCGSYALFGTNNGCIGVYANGHVETFVSPHKIVETFHWFEEVGPDEFIAACDQRFLVRVVVRKTDTFALDCEFGELFTNDDLEHITRSKGGRLLASSFDRNVYEIDPANLNPIKVAFKAPFKTRWVKFSEADPSIAFVQVRDGSIIKFNCDTGERISEFKQTPPAVWSCCNHNDDVIACGEEGLVLRIGLQSDGPVVVGTAQVLQKLSLDGGYFKRIELGKNSEALLGSTCGKGYLIKDNQKIKTFDFSAAVRDISFSIKTSCFYVALEDGRVLQLLNDKTIEIFRSSEPIWSIAVSPTGEILAVGERGGSIYLLDTNSHQVVEKTLGKLPKRMKWLSPDALLVTHRSAIDKVYREDGVWYHDVQFVDSEANTVEDFVVFGSYVIFVNYANRIYLGDIVSGDVLDSCYYGAEHMKAINISKTGVVSIMGRGGTIKNYIIHSEQILPVGETNLALSEAENLQ